MSNHVAVSEEPKRSFLSLSQRTFIVGTAKINCLFQLSSIVENFCFPFCLCRFRKNEDANVIKVFEKTRVVNNFYFFLIAYAFALDQFKERVVELGDAKVCKRIIISQIFSGRNSHDAGSQDEKSRKNPLTASLVALVRIHEVDPHAFAFPAVFPQLYLVEVLYVEVFGVECE
jgi:hypothetical protein